jgi:uncharacterized protein (DUF2267 family)
MSASTVAALDHTIQETNIWLKALGEKLHFTERHYAYSALRAVLHALRDRLTPEMAVHLGAQFPMLLRGLYYEGWHIAGKPTKDRSAQEFADRVLKELPPQFPIDPLTVTRGVFEILGRGWIRASLPRSSTICRRRCEPCGLRSPDGPDRVVLSGPPSIDEARVRETNCCSYAEQRHHPEDRMRVARTAPRAVPHAFH